MSANDSDDESSGFGDFCGYNLHEDLSSDEQLDDDELERPGKTYEYVNFVDPQYAEKRQSESFKSSQNDSDDDKEHKPRPFLVPNDSISHHYMQSSSRLMNGSPTADDTIPEDEENNPDYINNELSQYTQHQLQRQYTEHEIAAGHGSVRTSKFMNDGRRALLNYRRHQRRYVWKDAELFDITCVIASPCIKPNITKNQCKMPSLRVSQSDQSTESNDDVCASVKGWNSWSLMTEKEQQHNKKRKKKKKKKKKRSTTQLAASDSELMKRDKSVYRYTQESAIDCNTDTLQHFDIKGIQTLLYDGILCSIHQTARFMTFCGNICNVRHNMKGCKLLHYIGYAANGKLLLESDDDVGLGHWFDPTDMNIIDKMTQCVVIQSPTHMEVANIFIKLKVKHVIAIKQQQDNFAHHITDFINQFYFALIESNTTIARAFRTGLNLFEGLKYMDSILTDFRLLPENEDHELILFRNGLFDAGKPINYSHKLSPQNNLHAISPFIGRWNDVYKVMNMIRDKKLSIVCSHNEGCGRSSTIVTAARYLWERGKFKGGVFHIKNNFNVNKIKNLADLILHNLSVSGVDGFEDIAAFHREEQDKYNNKSELAVELLYRYVFRDDDDESHPICLLFSDFDLIPFPPADKYAFMCALIDKFDEEIEEAPDIGTRVVITCRVAMLSQLHYFMDHINNEYREMHSNHLNPTDNYYKKNNYYKLPMQYKRGHQVIKALHEDDLIDLFLQMIHIASTETIYKFQQIKSHKGLLRLFHHQPLKVKQIAEYVLQTFDDNLSRQQFHYEEFEEADYGLIYQYDSDSDSSDSDSQGNEDEDEEVHRLSLKPFMTSINSINTSKLDLKLDPFSDYTPSPFIDPVLAPRLSTESNGSKNKKRNSKPIKVISIKTIKLQDSVSNKLSNKLVQATVNTHSDHANKANVSYPNLLKDRASALTLRGSLSVNENNAQLVENDSVPIKRHRAPIDNINDSVDLLPTIHSVRESSLSNVPGLLQGKSYKVHKYLPAPAFSQSVDVDVTTPSPKSKLDVLLESTIVTSDDCHILLTKSTSASPNLSSRNICVDMAITPMDYKRTFIRQKIHYLIHKKNKHRNKSLDLPIGHNVEFETSQSYHILNIHTKEESTKIIRPNLQLTNESIPIGTRESGGTLSLDPRSKTLKIPREQKEQTSIDDSIKKAWPGLDDIVDGFTLLQKERISNDQMNYRKSLIFTHQQHVDQHQMIPHFIPTPNIAHVPREPQIRFKNIDLKPKTKASSPLNKPYNINVSSFNNKIINEAMQHHNVIANSIAREIWNSAGGNQTDTLSLDDLIMDFYNYFTEKTRNQYLRIDMQSFAPLLKQFSANLEITATMFDVVWTWFDSLCDIVNETTTFWNNKFASNHGFVTRQNAEKELMKTAKGTFIIRFSAPNPDIIVTFNDPRKQYTNNPITNITFIRRNNCDLYEIQSRNNSNHKDKLKIWIQKMSEFQYIFTKDLRNCKKDEYFW